MIVSVQALALSALSIHVRGSQLSLLHTKYSLFSVEHWRPIILEDAHSCSDVIEDDDDDDDDDIIIVGYYSSALYYRSDDDNY